MAKVIFAHGGISDAASLAASSFAANMPVTNLQKRQPGDRWRALTLTPSLVIDLGAGFAAYEPNWVALLSINATAAATWRARMADTEGALTAAPDYDSGVMGLRPAGATETDPYFIASLFKDAETYRYIRIDVDDGANADGFLDFGRLYVSEVTEPEVNTPMAGLSRGYTDLTRKRRTVGGQRYVTRRALERLWSFEMNYGTEAEMLGASLALDARVGTGGDLMCCVDHEEPTYLAQGLIYGEFQSLQPVVSVQYKRFSKRFAIEELLP